MYELTKIEEILLLSIWHLKGDAYGVKIRHYVSDLIGKDFTYGNLYSALNQLVRKRYVVKSVGEPTPERRGRPKVYYSITRAGLDSLKKAQAMNEALWAKVPKLAFD